MRGQTTLDFAVGVSLFLLVLTGAFIFVPGLLQPFTEGGQETIVTVNKVADDLSEGALADPRTPYVLDTACTEAFFLESVSPPESCGYEGGTLRERTGIGENQRVEITLRGNVDGGPQTDDVLCWDESDTDFAACNSGDELAVGDTDDDVPESAVTARRVVEFHGEDVFLVVELW